MRVSFTVHVELERTEGKFASKDEIRDFIRDEIEGMNPDCVDGVGADGASSYEITDWSVEDMDDKKKGS